MRLDDVKYLVKETFKEWSEDKASRLAAALSYYALFSIPPLLIIALAIAGWWYGQQGAQSQIQAEIQQYVGPQAAQVIQSMMENASRPGGGLIATVIGVGVLFLGASGVVVALQDAMNTIWEVQPRPNRGIRGTIKDRFGSVLTVLVAGVLVLAVLILHTALAAVSKHASGLLPFSGVAAQLIGYGVSLVLFAFLFALIYKMIPDVNVAWSDVWVGAIVTAVLFLLGNVAITLYLGRGSTTSSYAAAGSLVALLLWIYYSTQVIFIGAEFTQVYANHYGSRIRAEEDDIPITEEERAQQGIPYREVKGEKARKVG